MIFVFMAKSKKDIVEIQYAFYCNENRYRRDRAKAGFERNVRVIWFVVKF